MGVRSMLGVLYAGGAGMVQELVKKRRCRTVQNELVHEAVHGVVKVWFA